MKICGIYVIKNLINNKIYIGQSTNIYLRFINHNHRQKCYYCGKRFGGKKGQNICNKCRGKNIYGEDGTIIGICPNCKKEFIKNNNKQKYCKTCAKTIRREQHKLIMRKIRSVRK